MQVEQINTAALVPYARNSRTHSDEQVAQVAASIREFGFTNPVLIDSGNGIIAGHGRVLAAQQIGMETVPCIRLDHLTEAQKRAYIIADNKLALNAGWDEAMLAEELGWLDDLGDFDMGLTGFDLDEFEPLMAMLDATPEGNTDEDSVPDIPETPITVPGDIWLLGKHGVMCGDSTSVDAVGELMNGEKADMVFTDPPYGVSYASKNEFLNGVDKGNRIQTKIKNDHMTLDETGKLWADTFSLWSSFLSDKSSYYIASPQGGDLFLMMMMMNNNGFPLRHCLIWNKNNHVLGRCDYNYKHEPILYGWANTHVFYGAGEMTKSVWDIPKPHKNDLHPTMKPIALIVNAILNSSKAGDIVADMFGGSGSTLIACEKTGRACRMMELDEHYCDVIVKRWQEFTGKQATHAETGKTFDAQVKS